MVLNSIKNTILASGLLLISPALTAMEFTSTDQLPLMLELYTSEGCSSCPPAEQYLNTLKHHPQLWKTFFPVAFHVDYWNDLGWKDRFSSDSYSQRQRNYARHHKRRTVYTPALYVNGENRRANWYEQDLPVASTMKTGILTIDIAGNQLKAHYQSQLESTESLSLHLAIVGMGLTSKIKTGENAGRNAEHEFVVLDYSVTNSSKNNWQLNLPSVSSFETNQLALVAWVSQVTNPAPLQVVGGPYFLKN